MNMLKELIQKYGKDKINTLTKYPSILTLHKFGEKGRFTDDFTTDIVGEKMYATEKIDGTNVRIICYGDKFLIGSRKCILHYSDDFYWDESMDIVNQFFKLEIPTLETDTLMIIYGELFGGKTTAFSKNYGKDKHGFRVFDIAEINDLSILEKPINEISAWRESTLNSETDDTLRYGQSFLNRDMLLSYSHLYTLVPDVEYVISDYSHESIFNSLKQSIPKTLVALSDSAQGKTEGLVLRNYDRSRIVKIRFEDYARTLRGKQTQKT